MGLVYEPVLAAVPEPAREVDLPQATDSAMHRLERPREVSFSSTPCRRDAARRET
jgi:hypothetical protein